MAARSRLKTGAGTLVWVRRYDLVEFAVVLEPDEAADLGAPGVVCRHECAGRRDSGALPARAGGQFRLARRRSGSTADCWAAPGSAGPAIAPRIEIPAWLVFGVILRAADMAHIEEVQAAAGVAHAERRFRDDRYRRDHRKFCASSDDRHSTDGRERGFEAIARDYLARLAAGKAGERRGIDVNGDLLVRAAAGRGPPERTSLVDALARADWYDRQARGPKLG